jgi:hypothetical protein
MPKQAAKWIAEPVVGRRIRADPAARNDGVRKALSF